jgi:hypothetical protein
MKVKLDDHRSIDMTIDINEFENRIEEHLMTGLLDHYRATPARRHGCARLANRCVARSARAPALLALGVGLVWWPLQHFSPLGPGVPALVVHAASILALYALSLRYGLKIRLSELRRFSAADVRGR